MKKTIIKLIGTGLILGLGINYFLEPENLNKKSEDSIQFKGNIISKKYDFYLQKRVYTIQRSDDFNCIIVEDFNQIGIYEKKSLEIKSKEEKKNIEKITKECFDTLKEYLK